MKAGDVVRLKSGGPDMTVNSVGTHDVRCIWFADGEHKSGSFKKSILVVTRSVEPAANTTHVIQVMDGSGSMAGIWDEIQGMLRKQWDAHSGAARDGQDIRITTFVFDNEIYPPVLENASPLRFEFRDLTMPGGTTALRDAIGRAILIAKDKFNDGENEAVLIQIFTDGMENASIEWTASALQSEIKYLQDTGKWTFQFFGANQIAERTAFDFGIYTQNAIRFKPTFGGVKGMSSVLNRTIGSYYTARAAGETSMDNSFGDGEDKMISDDGTFTSGTTDSAPPDEDLHDPEN